MGLSLVVWAICSPPQAVAVCRFAQGMTRLSLAAHIHRTSAVLATWPLALACLLCVPAGIAVSMVSCCLDIPLDGVCVFSRLTAFFVIARACGGATPLHTVHIVCCRWPAKASAGQPLGIRCMLFMQLKLP
jgi:hypothetical protein